MTFHDGDVMPTVRTTSTVNDDSNQVIHAVQVDSITGGVEEPELQREDHPVRQLGVPVELLHVLEPL